MKTIGKQISEARHKKQLSVKQLSESTKIRPQIIQAIERDDYSIMPEVYMRSFIRTICQLLEISIETPTKTDTDNIHKKTDSINEEKIGREKVKDNLSNKEKKQESVKKNEKVISDDIINKSAELENNSDDTLKKENERRIKTFDDTDEEYNVTSKIAQLSGEGYDKKQNKNFSEIFKKKKVNSGINPNTINYLIYATVALSLIIIIYFTFFYESAPFAGKVSKNIPAPTQDTAEVEKNNLFDFFSSSDSLTLTARARDTAWLKIQVDGKTSEELLMLPGMERRWSALEHFTINQGNVGAIVFIRNGEQLPNFGKRGTVVRNVRITREEVLANAPWQDDPSTRFGAVKEVPREIRRYNRRDTVNQRTQPRLIEPSRIEPERPNLLQERRPQEQTQPEE